MNPASLPAIGTPVYDNYGNLGYVSQVTKTRDVIYTIGTGAMRPVSVDVEIIVDGRLTTLPDTIAESWAARAANRPAISAEEVEALRAEAVANRAAAHAEHLRQTEAAEKAREAFIADARTKTPAWAKAVIVAELEEDDSDSQSDYFATKTVRTVILAFSKHCRDLFPELRKAARNFAETADLADADEHAEPREKYSMGHGYYLKDGRRYQSGWRVVKHSISGPEGVPSGEWSLTPPADAPKAQSAAPAPVSGGVSVTEHVHTKKGFKMWIVSLADRVEREEFDRLLSEAKAAGGWYSRAWAGTPAGFAFKVEDAARTFAAVITSNSPAPDDTDPTPPKGPNGPGTADKLRAMADKMQGDIDAKFAPRLENTPKRQREAQSARLEGERLKRTQQAMRALADLHEAGDVPADLRNATTKTAIYELCRAKIVSTGGYYDAGHETGGPAIDSPATRALWAMLRGPSVADLAKRELHDKITSLQFAKIPGYFPTPAPVVARMIDAAEIPPGGCRVLEPSAGSGAILDQVREAAPGCEFIVYERNNSLREILTAKGYTLDGADFTRSDPSAEKVDRVLMNPPFEKSQDIEHVMRAYSHLAPGGRLIAIMSPGAFFRTDSAGVAFREWFALLDGQTIAELPAGTFKESGTGVASVMIEIRA